MSYDLVIRGGDVVDGTGAPRRRADVAVSGDRVAAVAEPGSLDTDGARVVEAEDRLVTPGFVDIHTHLDAQLSWDPQATSSCWHGVTSVVLGNCGVTFAPCRPEDRRYLAEMMESVEDIPADSIMDGLSWNWESYGEYLADLDRLPKGVNAGGMVGHCAVRYNAMGERGLDDTEPTATELAGMQATVDEAMTAGALGFSTSRTLLHRGADGRPIPGTFASVEELMGIVSVLGRHGRGVFEAAAMLGDETEVGGDVAQREIARFGDVSRTTGRPMTFGLTHIFAADSMHTEVLASVAAENASGATLFPQTTVRGIGIIFGLAHRTPWDRRPVWAALQELTLEERLAVIRDPPRRAELVAEATAHPSRLDPAGVFPLVEAPAQYRYEAGDSLAAEAARRGVDPAEAYLQLADETDGRALLNWPFLNQRPDAVEEMLGDPNVVLGLADAGAHVGQIMDASQPTWWLSHWVRDRGRWSVEEGIRRLTSAPAALYSIPNRGVIAEGAFADLNVIDLDALALPLPEFVHDLPGGAGRWIQRGSGYDMTVVNGVVTVEAGTHTGNLPGRTLRSTD